MKTVTAQELQQWISSGKKIQLIDVREPDEHEAFNIGGELIPLGEIGLHPEKISGEVPVVLYCRKGIRSQFAIQKLETKFLFTQLYNLAGGTEAWIKFFHKD